MTTPEPHESSKEEIKEKTLPREKKIKRHRPSVKFLKALRLLQTVIEHRQQYKSFQEPADGSNATSRMPKTIKPKKKLPTIR